MATQYDFITDADQLQAFCERIAGVSLIGFDTEFVAEDRYRPELCLLQVAAGDQLAIIDTLSLSDLTPFWHLLATPGHTTIVHAGREEYRFCLQAIGQRPTKWFDIQLAAGMVGLEYPASYGTLCQKLARVSLRKGETRTDWRRRPLTSKQLDYALQDVVHLSRLHARLEQALRELDRLHWLDEETLSWQQRIEEAEEREQWRRVSGISGLPPRTLAIVREIWRWRDRLAAERDRPPKHILRDDLIVELSKRGTADVRGLRAIRGMERRSLQKDLPDLAAAIQRGLELPEPQCPQPLRHSNRPQYTLLGQFLSTAIGSVCRARKIAPSLVATTQDIRDFLADRLGPGSTEPSSSLHFGWRAELIGKTLDQVLDGQVAVKVSDARSDHPLEFVKQSDA